MNKKVLIGLGVLGVAGIAYYMWKKKQDESSTSKNETKTPETKTPETKPTFANARGGGLGSVCSDDSYICGITEGGTVRCCPLNSVE